LEEICQDASVSIERKLEEGHNINILGVSLGNAIALKMAAIYPCKNLVSVAGGARLYECIEDSLFTKNVFKKSNFSEEDYRKLTEYMLNKFRASGIEIKKIYYCPHHPEDNCDCRKPKIKFLKEASREFSIDLNSSWVIGDKLTDIELGKNAGCKTILIDSKYVSNIKIEKAKDLLEASHIIINCQ
jgi:hypothetical protein